MNGRIALVIACMFLLAASAEAQRSRFDRSDRSDRWRNGSNPSTRSSSDSGDAFASEYAVVSERNIFLRDRRPRNTERNSGPRAPSDPDLNYVVTGVLFEDDQFTAYIEDVRAGRLLRLHPGDAVSQGHVVQIEIDAIAYARDGVVRWVDVGSNLGGGSVSSVSDARVNAALTSGPGEDAAAVDPNAANLSIEERMRLRRLQELGAPTPVPEAQPVEQPADSAVPSQGQAPPELQGPVPGEMPPQSNLTIEEQMRLRREQELNRGQ